MSAKWSVSSLVRDHFKTFVDQRSGKVMLSDYVGFVGVPLASGASCFIFGFRLQGVEGILAGVAIFTALLFGLLIHGFTLGLRVSDDARIPKRGRVATLVDQMQANLAYAVLVGVVTSIVLILAVSTTLPDHALGTLISAVAVVLLLHLLMTIFMALKRLQAAYRSFRS